MIVLHHARGDHYALFGLARSGLAAAQALAAGGARVDVWDESETGREKAKALGLTIVDLNRSIGESDYKALVLSPGIPHNFPSPHPLVAKAKAFAIPVIGDGELFARERAITEQAAPLIAVTGTNGKSTTSALIAHLLSRRGIEVGLGGNIGRSMLDLPSLTGSKACYVLEISSYQAELAPSLQPDIGVLTNLSADHIDRHGTMDNYAAIKKALIKRSAKAVVGCDDNYCLSFYQQIRELMPCLGISGDNRKEAGVFFEDQTLWLREGDGVVPVFRLDQAPDLRGRHNGQNAATALGALLLLDEANRSLKEKAASFVEDDVISFSGLPHRMKYVSHRGKVAFYNDSKATNGSSAATAVQTFRKVHLILGGRAKDDGIEALKPLFSHITRAYLMGESSPVFASSLEGQVPFVVAKTLPEAITQAYKDALASEESDPVVLLSPAAASFDQFKDFEERGQVFCKLVTDLPDL